MTVKEAVVERFLRICAQRGIRLNDLANRAGVTPSTVYSMCLPERKSLSIGVIKELCDGLDMSLGEFFSDPLFDALEQEIR